MHEFIAEILVPFGFTDYWICSSSVAHLLQVFDVFDASSKSEVFDASLLSVALTFSIVDLPLPFIQKEDALHSVHTETVKPGLSVFISDTVLRNAFLLASAFAAIKKKSYASLK